MTPPGASGKPLALTMGEPAGIGGEISLKAWLSRDEGVPPFFLIDDPERMRRLARRLSLAVPVEAVDDPDETEEVFSRALPVLSLDTPVEATLGEADPAHARAVISAVETAVGLTRESRAAAVVTNPINKKALYQGGFRFPGHTEFLASLAGGGARPVMMLASSRLRPPLRVVPVTVHVSLAKAVQAISSDLIVETGTVTARALQREFGIEKPRIAVSGLNPHAGEGGALGSEEMEIVAPAIVQLRQKGLNVWGPVSADTLFTEGGRRNYDAALCMTHDQALIPIKALDFEGAVNVTLGLPFIRTSPDHGTALDIANAGGASEASLVAALKMAAHMAEQRALAPA